MSTRRVELEAHSTDRGRRLDQFLSQQVAGIGRRQAALLCAQGQVRIDGHRAKKSTLLEPGAKVTVEFTVPASLPGEPEIELELRLERPEFVIVNKRSGMPSAPLDTSECGTLCGALLGHYPEMRGVGHRAREPGIVHRLDTQTSGLLLAARNADAFQRLTAALDAEQLKKRYLAVVSARDLPDAGEISRPLAPDAEHPERVLVLESGEQARYARHKLTRYRVLRRGAERALLEVEVGSAFRHQIRAHLAALGHPIAGDAVYGGEPVMTLGARHALHASRISWAGDATLAGFDVYEPLPTELERLLDE